MVLGNRWVNVDNLESRQVCVVIVDGPDVYWYVCGGTGLLYLVVQCDLNGDDTSNCVGWVLNGLVQNFGFLVAFNKIHDQIGTRMELVFKMSIF